MDLGSLPQTVPATRHDTLSINPLGFIFFSLRPDRHLSNSNRARVFFLY
jgi:hypothetical protein